MPRFQVYFERPPVSTALKVARVAMVVAALYGTVIRPSYGYYYVPALTYPAAGGQRPPSSPYVYIVAAHADAAGVAGPGILKVRKESGKPERRVVVGIKSPDFRLDEPGGLLFLKRDDQQIVCYRF